MPAQRFRAPLRTQLRAAALLAALLTAASPALHAAPSEPVRNEVGGVRFEREATVAGQRLQLNGAGIRTKIVFKVYAAALYLPQRTRSPEAVWTPDGPRRMQVHMLRGIQADELGRMFTKGMEKNATREEFARSIPGTIRMGEIFAQQKRLSPGDVFTLDWIPGTGTVISINGKPAGEPVREPEFYTALIKIWLGHEAADDGLKAALLGQSGQPGTAD
ncbi:MAG: chalcone isomerase family protein [Aquabacterium sp.]|nr:chalcone isomerase family protein [Aquabacterium sp.]